MSTTPHSAAPAAPSFTVAAWDAQHPLDDIALRKIISDARVIAVGESAHFIDELSDARAGIAAALVRDFGVDDLALEIGHDEAPLVEDWLSGQRTEELRSLVGTLTFALYGTFLVGLRSRLPRHRRVRVLGVDLPNSLTIEPSLAPLSTLLDAIDPAAAELLRQTRELAGLVVGGSAAASAASWLGLETAAQDSLTVHLTRLRARIDALGAVHRNGEDAQTWRQAGRLADTAVTTEIMLRAMGDLFSGTGRLDDTTVREVFVARRLVEAVDSLAPKGRIAYVAHNNHIQKAPVAFDGVLAAHPAGEVLAESLGSDYRAIALTHADDEVPEMAVPVATQVGFRVERVAAASLRADSVEAACADLLRSAGAAVARFDGDGSASAYRVRSQSADVEVDAAAFDAVVVVASAATDPAVTTLGLD